MKTHYFKVIGNNIKNICYTIYNSDDALLIDPAWDFFQIYDYVKEHNLNLRAILLTHSHFDHVNLANMFALKFNIPVYMSDIEIDTYKFSCSNLNRASHLQEICIGNLKVIPICTPGHTSGSMCFQIDQHLFTGDTIFTEGVGICTQAGGDVNKLYDSVQFIKNNIPHETLIWPGHSFGIEPGKTLEFLLNNNIYFQFNENKYFIDFRMRENQPAVDKYY